MGFVISGFVFASFFVGGLFEGSIRLKCFHEDSRSNIFSKFVRFALTTENTKSLKMYLYSMVFLGIETVMTWVLSQQYFNL